MYKLHVQFEDWHEVAEWCDDLLSVPPSYVDKVNSRLYPKDAFTLGQVSSKAWMISQLTVMDLPKPQVIAILGCWIGSAVPYLTQFCSERIYGIDQDAHSVELSEQFNQQLVQDSWRYKGVVADVNSLNISDMQFETGGELITVSPDWIINTSCEHMSTDWFHSCHSEQLIIMQTNDSEQYEGHINTCNSVQQMQDKYPLANTLFSGSIKTPAYTRMMQIGYKH